MNYYELLFLTQGNCNFLKRNSFSKKNNGMRRYMAKPIKAI